MKTVDCITVDKPLGSTVFDEEPNWQAIPLEAWNATDQVFPQTLCVHQLVPERAAATPDATAVVAGAQVLSYAQLEARANRLAHHLCSLGVGRERIVAIYLDRSIEFVVTALSVLKAGGAYLPLDPDSPVDRVAFMLRDAEAQVLVTSERKTALASGGRGNGARPGLRHLHFRFGGAAQGRGHYPWQFAEPRLLAPAGLPADAR
jgi:non-ribosomal peptide synthetase component F